MFFLIRSAFWLCLVILLIPGDPASGTDAPRVSLGQAVSAAGATIADLSGFCSRNPEACATGGTALAMIGEKAWQGAEFLIAVLADNFDGAENEPVAAGTGTLTAADLAMPWQAPGSGRDTLVLASAP
jgi:hypothetical protein